MNRGKPSIEQQLLIQMGRSVVPVDEPDRQEHVRQRVVPRLQHLHRRTLVEAERRERRQRWFGLVAVAVIPFTVAGAYYGWSRAEQAEVAVAVAAELRSDAGDVFVTQRGVRNHVSRGTSVGLIGGDGIATGADGRATVTVSRSTRIDMAPDSRLTLESQSLLGLSAGRVVVQVQSLSLGERFEVRTSDAMVEVHGTHFSVDKDSQRTLVEVYEGRVLVRHRTGRTALSAGARWSSSQDTPALSMPDAPSLALSLDRPGNAPDRAADRPAPSAPAGRMSARDSAGPDGEVQASSEDRMRAASSLAAQNRLFQEGMNARRSGDASRALSLFGELLSRYPKSPLSENARVERFRALFHLGRIEEAAREARRYLAFYPQGFAKEEARRLVLRTGERNLD